CRVTCVVSTPRIRRIAARFPSSGSIWCCRHRSSRAISCCAAPATWCQQTARSWKESCASSMHPRPRQSWHRPRRGGWQPGRGFAPDISFSRSTRSGRSGRPHVRSAREIFTECLCGSCSISIGAYEPMVSYKYLKRILFGRPLASDRLEHERLSKKTALAVLSSDAISSVAYATDQILLVLGVLGSAALSYVVPISAVIAGLLALVALSYRQTIFAYPRGGGSYTVAKENLGQMPGLIAAASLLTDYILTVSVSVSRGVAQIASAYPSLKVHTVLICIVLVFVLMSVN